MSAKPTRLLIGMAAGGAISLTLAMHFFNFNELALIDRLFLLVVPAFALIVCICYLIPFLEEQIEQTSVFTKIYLLSLAVLSALTAVVLSFENLNALSIGAFVSLFILFLAGVIPSAPFVQRILDANLHLRIFGGWLASNLIIFFLAGFLDNYYGGFFEFVCLMLFLQFAVGLAGYFLAVRMKQFLKMGLPDVAFASTLFLLLFVFIASIFVFGSRYPQLFNPTAFSLKSGLLPVFLAVSLLALPWQAWMMDTLKSKQFFKLKETGFYSFVNENIAGILLATVFFSLHLLTTSMLNHPRFDVDDVFFDADVFNWRLRFTTDNLGDYYWRSVHPFILIVLKPPIELAAMFLKGDKLVGAYIIVALGGAACIFLTWKFILRVTEAPVYALLTAALLGLTASHLIFGSLIESYIFLTASLLLFFVMLAEDRPFPALVMAGLATIGITHSNFAQNVIAFFTVKPGIKQTFRFIATVLVFLVLLTLLNNLLYPEAHPFFFIPSTLQAEQQNLFPLNTLRIQALVRAFLFHNVVAPTPILYSGDIPFIQFRFFKPEINKLSGYDTLLQNATVLFWLGLLALSVLTYFINFKKNKYKPVSLALLACILMNIGLHLRYGKELFLYSPNWTYALILLAALGWQGLAKYKWFQAVLLLFLMLLALNNGLLLREILGILALQI